MTVPLVSRSLRSLGLVSQSSVYSSLLTYSVPLSCRSSPRLHRHPEGKVTRDGVCNERGTERSEKGGE